jgi:dihydropteroate synthase
MPLGHVSNGSGPWSARPPRALTLADGTRLDMTARPLVMGILNVTPDSFSDGDMFADVDAAVAQARHLCDEGADILDIGGESTRPGSDAVSATQEMRRVLPVIEALAGTIRASISIDTQKAAVAAAALDAGAAIVNDVSALRADAAMAGLCADRGAPVVLMHMLGTPRTMQRSPRYADVVAEVAAWLAERIDSASEAGIAREKLVVDPGIGFGKTIQHNLELMRGLDALHALGAPVLLGASRKSTIGAVLGGVPPEARLCGTLATTACAAMSGCHIVRVHDVGPTREVLTMCEAIRRGMQYRA